MMEDEYRDRILELQNQNQQLKKSLEQQTDLFSSLDEDNNRRYDEVKHENDRIKEELKEARKHVESYKLTIERIQGEYEELLNRPSESDHRTAKKVEIEYIQDDVLKSDEYIDLKNKYDNLYSKYSSIKKDYMRMEEDYKGLKEEYIRSKKELTTANEELLLKVEEFEAKEREHNMLLNNLHKEEDFFEANFEYVVPEKGTSLLSEFEDRTGRAEAEATMFKQMYAKMKKDYVSLRAAFQRAIATVNSGADISEVEHHMKANSELMEQIQRLNRELVDAKEFERTWRVKNLDNGDNRVLLLKAKTKEIDSLKQKIAEYESKLNEQNIHLLLIPSLQKAKRQLEATIFYLEERVKHLTDDKENLSKMPTLKKENNDLTPKPVAPNQSTIQKFTSKWKYITKPMKKDDD